MWCNSGWYNDQVDVVVVPSSLLSVISTLDSTQLNRPYREEEEEDLVDFCSHDAPYVQTERFL